MKKLFISEPMMGKTFDEVEESRDEFVRTLDTKKYTPVGNLTPPEFIHDEEDPYDVINEALYCLAESLDAMSRCDITLFRKGWENERSCRIEHECAKAYGLDIIYED